MDKFYPTLGAMLTCKNPRNGGLSESKVKILKLFPECLPDFKKSKVLLVRKWHFLKNFKDTFWFLKLFLTFKMLGLFLRQWVSFCFANIFLIQKRSNNTYFWLEKKRGGEMLIFGWWARRILFYKPHGRQGATFCWNSWGNCYFLIKKLFLYFYLWQYIKKYYSLDIKNVINIKVIAVIFKLWHIFTGNRILPKKNFYKLECPFTKSSYILD